jgi:hypothetical protein
MPQDFTLIKYADDFALGYHLKTSQNNIALQENLQKVVEWSTYNDLALYSAK